jgi:predicted nucleic acid-binding protein
MTNADGVEEKSEEVVLLDTDVISYRFAKRPEFEKYKPLMQNKIPAISFATYAEAIGGAIKAKWGEKRMRSYESYLRTYLLLPADKSVARVWGEVYAECVTNGLGPDDNDIWNASVAIKYDVSFITNDGDYDGISRLKLLKPDKI